MMLHGDGKFSTYLSFFSHLAGEMATDLLSTEVKLMDSLVTGSDKE